MSAVQSARPSSNAFLRSPNRQRLVARAAVWTVGAAAAVFWLPHFLF